MSAADEAARAEAIKELSDISYRGRDTSHGLARTFVDWMIELGWLRHRDSDDYEVVVDAEGERIIRAKSKRSQPIEVTEEMVVAAADEIRRYAYPHIARTSPPGSGWIDQARAALTAALDAAKEPEQ